MKLKYNWFAIVLSFCFIQTNAQQTKEDSSSKLHYEFSIGTKIGGASPIPLPAEIRKIKSYSPTLPFFVSARVNYQFSGKWGLTSGLTFEGRAMNTKAEVKGYKTMFNANEDPTQNISGYYTGSISTSVHNMYLTLPILATYSLSPNWKLLAGPYISYAVKKQFYGTATDGYMRDQDPTGVRVDIDAANYDFKKNVRNWDFGASIGGQYYFAKHYFATAQMDYGFTSIMQTGFQTISFGLHNVFLNLGVGMRL